MNQKCKGPVVSVITPAYNHERFISECIESVLAQTYPDWEMIIVDDGSTDQTAGISERYAEKDSRIRLIKQENVGVFRLAESYNKAFHQTNGDYIAILEGDDYWEPGKLSLQVEAMQNNPDAVLCWGIAAARVGNSRETYLTHPVNLLRNRHFYDNSPVGSVLNVMFDDFLVPVTYLIRKSALEKIGGFIQVQPFPAVDLSTLLPLSKLGKFIFIDQILGTWRIFPQQTTKTKSTEILEGSQKIILDHYNSLSDQEKSLLFFDEKYIMKQYRRRKVIALARAGRFKLIRKEFREARKDYLKAIFSCELTEPVWKLRAITGLCFSFLHRDVEKLAKWFGKGSLKL